MTRKAQAEVRGKVARGRQGRADDKPAEAKADASRDPAQPATKAAPAKK